MLSLTMSTPFPGTGTPRFRPAVTPFVPQCTHTTEHRQNSRVECCRPQATKPRGVRRQRMGRQPALANHRTRPHGPWRTIGHATVPATPAATTARPARPIARPHPSLGRPAGLMVLFCASPRCSETVMARLPQPGTKTIKNAKMLGERHLGRET